MPNIHFIPQNVTVSVPPGRSLLDAAGQAGIALAADCGGQGVCGRCAVRLVSGAALRDCGELTESLREKGFVLACKTFCGEEDLTVEANALPLGAGQFVETAVAGAMAPAMAGAMAGVDVLAPGQDNGEEMTGALPMALRIALRVEPPALEDGLSDADRLSRALKSVIPGFVPAISLTALRELAAALREDGGAVTVMACPRGRELRVASARPGRAAAPCLGAAVDLGTTSVAVSLADLSSGRILAEKSAYNAQISRGLDVISRINYAAGPGRLEELRGLALATVNGLVADCAREAGCGPADVYAVSLAGNTVMSHLLLGLPPEHIRLSPYTPTALAFAPMTASEAGIGAHPEAEVFLAPCVGSYVGGDIVAGLLSTAMAGRSGAGDKMESPLSDGELELFLDIGTNGELVVGGTDFMMACACSAGPAFEGGGIACGMTARQGAIDRAALAPDGQGLVLSVIGGGGPEGICGSGVISFMAAMFRAGILDPAGKFDPEAAAPAIRERIRQEGRRAAFVLAHPWESATGKEIVITGTDVENCIRAKAAIYCACELLLAHLGLGLDDVARFYVAGGFGRFLDIEDATTIGLLPEIGREKFRYVGNASLSGARQALFSRDRRRRLSEIAKGMTYAELMASPDYMDGYVAALFLPHTDAARFPGVMMKLSERRPVNRP